MTLSQKISGKLLMPSALLSVALMASATILVPTASEARSTGAPAFAAELATTPKDKVIIIRGTAFSCNDTSCRAGQSASAAKNVCKQLVREAGTVTAFAYKGEAFDANALADCNGSERVAQK